MEVDWEWYGNLNLKKERRKNYELWKIWWTICTTRIKREFK